ncbi:MAG TPA: Ig-like domain-containing protein, partial [Chitinophagaceae bacterium]|nr:Ig-like domain-containing protein [Chitinophagaceae bacterium]
TGDDFFAKGYLLAQELRTMGTLVKIDGHEAPRPQERIPNAPATNNGKSVMVFATVSPMTPGRTVPGGSVTFYANNNAVSGPVKLSTRGRAEWIISGLDKGTYNIRAVYNPADTKSAHASSSPEMTVELPESTKHRPRSWYWWILILLLVLLIIWWLLR